MMKCVVVIHYSLQRGITP